MDIDAEEEEFRNELRRMCKRIDVKFKDRRISKIQMTTIEEDYHRLRPKLTIDDIEMMNRIRLAYGKLPGFKKKD